MPSLLTTPTREELYELVWARPLGKVAKQLGISDVGLAKLCKRHDIPTPPFGYWAKKKVGKEPPRPELPPAPPAKAPKVVRPKPKPRPKRVDAIQDEDLKNLLAAIMQPGKQIVVKKAVRQWHPLAASTKLREWQDERGNRIPQLSIKVGEELFNRALRLMDAVLKEFEKMGGQPIWGEEWRRQQCVFVLLGERLFVKVTERTKVYIDKTLTRNQRTLVPTGDLRLEIGHIGRRLNTLIYNDSSRGKLEERLKDILVGFIVAVQLIRNDRRESEERERQRQLEAEQQRAKQEELERQQRIRLEAERQQAARLKELYGLFQGQDEANRIRRFVLEYRSSVEQGQGPIEEGSEFAQWMEWALKHADSLDPLCRGKPIRDIRHKGE